MTLYKNCYFLFIIGGIGYSLIEVLWRGYTHPSMGIVGGLCLVAIWFINGLLGEKPIVLRALCCAALITGVELLSGIFLNIVLKLDVWDYSDRALNFMGQICALYSLLWFLLSCGVIYAIDRKIIPKYIRR